MGILANIGQESYVQILGANGFFAGRWLGKAILGATPIHLATQITARLLETVFRFAELPLGGGCRIIRINAQPYDRLRRTNYGTGKGIFG